MRGAVAKLYRDSLMRRLIVSLFLTHLLVMSAAAVLVTLWVRQALPAIENLGFVAGAFVLGAVGGGLVLGGRSHYPIRLVAVGIGYLAGAGAVAISGGVAPIRLLILVAAMVIGAGTASVTPVLGEVISQRVPASLRSRVGGLVATTAFAGLPLGAVGAAWMVGHTSLIRGVLVVAGCYLIAMLLPLVTYTTWRDLGLMAPAATGLMVSSPKLAARVTVTLAYANGQWIVEVRRGRALLGTRHLVKSAEAMDVLARLDMPAVQRSIESALAADQVEAISQADRMRGQLADVETRLADIAEMLEITDQRKAPVPATGARPVPDPETP
jgi:MFS family permease